MKQHMLTHKIRDMPSHLFEKTSPSGSSFPSSLVDETSNTSTESKEQAQLAIGNSAALRCVPIEALTTTAVAVAATATATTTTAMSSITPQKSTSLAAGSSSSPMPPESPTMVISAQKRSPDSDSNLPVPKRQPSTYAFAVIVFHGNTATNN